MNKSILGAPAKCFFTLVSLCIAGIIVGSFCDFRINELLENKTDTGKFYATWMFCVSYCFYPAAGTCLYKGLKAKGKHFDSLAKSLLMLSIALAAYLSEMSMGSDLRQALSYETGESSFWLYAASLVFWILFYSWIPFVLNKMLDEKNADRLIAAGAAIIIAGILAQGANEVLKQLGSRPRYKYLITLDDPISEYRNWWQIVPGYAKKNDYFKSWPSGHTTAAMMIFFLPALSDLLKRKSVRRNMFCFAFACLYLIVCGYNRIHMTNHFLSDVCFAALITYMLHCFVWTVFEKAAQRNKLVSEIAE